MGLWAIGLCLAGLFAARIVKTAAEPEFEIGIERYRQPMLEIEGLTFGRRLTAGWVEVHADRMRPGVQMPGWLKSKVAVYLALAGVEAKYHAGGAELWTIRGPSAKVENDLLEFTDRPVVAYPDGHSAVLKTLRFDLKTGGFSARQPGAPDPNAADHRRQNRAGFPFWLFPWMKK